MTIGILSIELFVMVNSLSGVSTSSKDVREEESPLQMSRVKFKGSTQIRHRILGLTCLPKMFRRSKLDVRCWNYMVDLKLKCTDGSILDNPTPNEFDR